MSVDFKTLMLGNEAQWSPEWENKWDAPYNPYNHLTLWPGCPSRPRHRESGNPRGAWWLPQVGKVELGAWEVQRSEVTGQSSQEDRDRQRHTEGPLEYLDKSDQCSLWGQCPRPGKAFQAGLEGTLPRAHRRPGLVLVPTGRAENLAIPGASEHLGGSCPGAVIKSAFDWSLVGTT